MLLNVFFEDSTVFAGAGDLGDVDFQILQKTSNGWRS